VDACRIGAVHDFDQTADVEFLGVRYAFEAEDGLVEHVMVAVFMVERAGDNDREVVAAVAVVIGVAAFDQP